MSFDDDDYDEEHERRIRRCRTCNAQIIWMKTAKQNVMPVDADSVDPGDEEFDTTKHVSHFASCPNSDKHRRVR